MAGKRWTIGFTLVELLVVVAIVGLLTALTVPNVPGMIRSHKMSAARNLIKSALGQAQAHAAKYQKYAGVRFQFDRNGWEKGQQYLVLIEHEPETGYSGRFVAVANAKPVALPSGIGVISMSVFGDGDLDNSPAPDSLLGATTFSIIFSPTGQLVTKTVGVFQRPDEVYGSVIVKDTIFGNELAVNSNPLPPNPPAPVLYYDNYNKDYNDPAIPNIYDSVVWCWAESSALGLYVYVTDAMGEVGVRERYSAFIGRHGSSEQVERILINMYMGTIINE